MALTLVYLQCELTGEAHWLIPRVLAFAPVVKPILGWPALRNWAVDTPAEESGVARPSDDIFRHSPLRASHDAFGLERYVLTFDDKRMREAAAAAPYEFIEIVVNGRKYGGGGIFNLCV
jgi:hypothetical protein